MSEWQREPLLLRPSSASFFPRTHFTICFIFCISTLGIAYFCAHFLHHRALPELKVSGQGKSHQSPGLIPFPPAMQSVLPSPEDPDFRVDQTSTDIEGTSQDQAAEDAGAPSAAVQSSPMVKAESSPAEFSAQLASSIQQLPRSMVESTFFNPHVGSACNDRFDGYQARVGLCSDIRERPGVIYLTLTTKVYIPWVLDRNAVCRSKECAKHDKYTCCRPRRRCSTHYLIDVTEGCPSSESINVYQHAYCRTSPCTIADFDICCVHPGALYYRTDWLRSKPARVEPRDNSAFASPPVSFAHHSIAWIDQSGLKEIGDSKWVPLVNFMSSWGNNMGWQTEAWIKVLKKGKSKYKPLTSTNLLSEA